MANFRDQQKEITSRRIFDAALLEFANNGYELTTLDDIAARSGVSKGLIIHRFGSKYELFIDILRVMGENYLYGEKHYASVTELFIRLARRIKDMAKAGNPALEYLNVFSFAMNTLPLNCTDKAREIVLKTDAYRIIKQAMDEGKMKQGDPFLVLEAFLRSSVGITKVYAAAGMGYPSDEMFIKPFEELFLIQDEVKVVGQHFETLDIARGLLSKKDIGLWAIEMSPTAEPKMYADAKMLDMLGVKNANLSPEKLYHAWFDRIEPSYIDNVLDGINAIINTKSFMEFQYPWSHPNGTIKHLSAGGIVDTSFKDGTRIEGTTQDVSHIVSSEVKAKASDTYLDIANALSSTFETIYYVDLKTDDYETYNSSEQYNEYHIPENGSAFFITSQKNAKTVVHPDDLAALTKFMDKENMLEAVKATGNAFIEYRLIFNGQAVHVRLIATLAEDKQHLVVGVENVEGQFKQSAIAKTKAEIILKSVTESYDFLTYVELSDSNEKDRDEVYHISDQLNGVVPGLAKEKKFGKKLDLIMNYLVASKDREAFEKAIRRSVVIDNLLDDDEYVVPFKAIIGGEEYYYQLKFTAEKIGNEFIGLVAGVGSIDSEVNTKQRMTDLEKEHEVEQAFTKLFADTYYSAYYVDLESNSFTTYKRQNVYAEQYFELENFEEYFEDYIEEDVFEPDRDILLELCKVDSIRALMRETDHHVQRYRGISEGQIKWYKMEIIKGLNKDAVAIGVMDIDDEIRKEQNEQQRLENIVKERTKALQDTNEQLQMTNRGIFELIGEIVEGRDKESGEHVKRVKTFTNILAKEVKFQFPEYHLDDQKIEDMTLASTLHDVGKIAISDTILLKPGRLTPEEFETMKTHTTEGAALLSKLSDIWTDDYLNMAMDICKYHHEKWDGRGYPSGLKGDDIPISAQIVSIADCFDALTTKRVYKDAYSCEKAFDMILNGECGVFSDKIISCLKAVKLKFFECQSDPNKFDLQIKRNIAKSAKKAVTAAQAEEVFDTENAISYKTLENILKELPSNIFYKDTKCRYVFCSQIWKQIKTEGDKNFSIKGKTDLEIRLDRDNAKRAFNEDRKIIKTGRPSEYVIQVSPDPNEPEYLELVKRPVRNEKGKIVGIVGQISDVTERVEMENTLKRLAKTDELTGFGNRQSYEKYIVETLPTVSFPVGVLMADCDRLKHVNDTFGHKAGDRFIKATASTLTAALPDNAEIFRIGGDEFLIIVPGSDMSDCEKYMEEIRAQSNLVVKDTRVSVSVGAAVMEWPDDDFKIVAEKADQAMYEEKNIKHAEQAKLDKKKKK